jgi:opacity protein-like surface antigen
MKKAILIIQFFSILIWSKALWASDDYSYSLHEVYEDTSDMFLKNCVVLGFVSNMPEEPFGIFLAKTRPGIEGFKMGFYVSFKANIPPMGNQVQSFNRHEAEDILKDQFQGEKNHYWTLNTGLTRTLSGRTTMYLGLGITDLQVYRKYYDQSGILGKHGQYFTKDQNRTYLNINWGFILQAENRVIVTFGIDSQPIGFNLGIGYLLWSK